MLLIMVAIIPSRASKLATQVMEENAIFISRLLSDNLSLGMQTVVHDDGAALEQTLGLLKKGTDAENTIQSVAIFDTTMKFIKGIRGDTVKPGAKTEKSRIESDKKRIVVFDAMRINEMCMSINEVAKNCHQELQIANDADKQAREALSSITELGNKAKDIGKIVQLIRNVAAQTNLLALNATIEASTAGDAGKGFAVVALEVKELAKKTAQATENISSTINEMQEKTLSSIKVIELIASIINQINSISHTIVSAVEEQSATANEISRNVSQTNDAASGIAKQVTSSALEIKQVYQIIQEVDKVANENDDNSKNMLSLVTKFTNLTGKLNGIVNQFKV